MSNYRQFHIRQSVASGWYAEEEATGRVVVENFANPKDAGATLVETLAYEGADLDYCQTEIHY